MRLFDSELKVMTLLWKYGDLSAKNISAMLAEAYDWKKNATYAAIKVCIEKGYIQKRDPGYVCHALISREAAQNEATGELIDKFFDGSREFLLASLVGRKKLSREEFERLHDMIDEMEREYDEPT